MDEIRFLGREAVLQIHNNQIELYGGQHGLRDEGLLQSALAQPRASFAGQYLHPSVFDMAGAYLYHLVCNHPFLDGNKRVGAAAALVFLDINGFEPAGSEEELYMFVVTLASGETEKEECARFLEAFVRPRA